MLSFLENRKPQVFMPEEQYRRSRNHVLWLGTILVSFVFCYVSFGFAGRWYDWLRLVVFVLLAVDFCRELPAFSKLQKRIPARPPSLGFQLGLILLPVLGLALVGCIGLYRDQTAVESETRRKAQTLTDQVAQSLAERLPEFLATLQADGTRWIGSPGVGPDELYWLLPPNNTAHNPTPEFRYWTDPGVIALRSEPGVPADPRVPEWVPVVAHFSAEGLLLDPRPYPAAPQPIGKDSAIDPFLDSASNVSRSTPEQLRNQWAELMAKPPASTNDDFRPFLQLSLEASATRTTSDTGSPLGAIAFAEALRRNPGAPFDSLMVDATRALVFEHPSLFTPWILDRAEAQARTSTNQTWNVQRIGPALRLRWTAQERLRTLSKSLAESVPLPSRTPQTLWLRALGGEWWISVRPVQVGGRITRNGQFFATTNTQIEARFYALDAVQSFTRRALLFAPALGALPSSPSTPPDRVPVGTRLTVHLDGHLLSVPDLPWVARTRETSPLLAESSAPILKNVSEVPQADGNNKLVADQPWPTQPRVSVAQHLIDRSALFQAQRRQQYWFGGMILLTACVAGVGAWQTHRTFQRQLAISEQKSNFVSAVSHELRAPLASLRLLAEGLADGRVSEESKRREYARFLVQETRRLGALVENVLGVSRLDSGRSRFEFAPTDFTRLVQETLNLHRPVATERHVTLKYAGPDPATNPVELIGDGMALQQVLLNLIDNALKHAPEFSTVLTSLEPADSKGRIQLRVQDSGPGIPAEDHERIFERFYRRGSELRRETQGVGLGLTLVRELVTAHGGTVRVESQPGLGATFIISLPSAGQTNPVE